MLTNEQILLRNTKRNIRKYNISIEEYKKLIVNSGNKCAICKKTEIRKTGKNDKMTLLCIDHCHSSNIVRGLLCFKCNTGIGQFEDNPELLKSAIKYLEHHSQFANQE
jgi:hypothetical protein